MIPARKIIKIPEFLPHLPEKMTKFPNFTWFLPENAGILHNNCPKNIFPESLGGTCPPSPKPMYMMHGLLQRITILHYKQSSLPLSVTVEHRMLQHWLTFTRILSLLNKISAGNDRQSCAHEVEWKISRLLVTQTSGSWHATILWLLKELKKYTFSFNFCKIFVNFNINSTSSPILSFLHQFHCKCYNYPVRKLTITLTAMLVLHEN